MKWFTQNIKAVEIEHIYSPAEVQQMTQKKQYSPVSLKFNKRSTLKLSALMIVGFMFEVIASLYIDAYRKSDKGREAFLYRSQNQQNMAVRVYEQPGRFSINKVNGVYQVRLYAKDGSGFVVNTTCRTESELNRLFLKHVGQVTHVAWNDKEDDERRFIGLAKSNGVHRIIVGSYR